MKNIFQQNIHKMNTVIVSAFMTDVNQRNDRKIPKYIEYGRELIDVCAITSTDIVLFLEQQVFIEYYISLGGEQWKLLYESDTNTPTNTPTNYPYKIYKIGQARCFIVYYEWNNMYLLSKEPIATEFNIKTPNPHKDTFRYMVVQCNKTEWMQLATTIYVPASNAHPPQYAWVDFGIYHMFPSQRIFQTRFFRFLQKVRKTSTVCFASCWNPYQALPPNFDLYKTIAWVFAGSVFYGDKQNLTLLAKKVREKCIEIINTRKTLMWEVNVWYMVFQEMPHIFSFYYCDHNQTILG